MGQKVKKSTKKFLQKGMDGELKKRQALTPVHCCRWHQLPAAQQGSVTLRCSNSSESTDL